MNGGSDSMCRLGQFPTAGDKPGKPLSFLDAHLRCGDSLLGIYDLSALQIGIPDDAYKPLTGDDKKAASAWKARNKSERDGRKQGELSFFEPPKDLLESFRAVESLAEDDLAEVRKKAEAYRALSAREAHTRMEAACDLYVAAFLTPKTEPPARNVGDASAFIPTSRDVWDKLEGKRPLDLVEHSSVAIARAARAFHWPLEFPQVFFSGAGWKAGFDLALGNPPWERIKLQEQEFFSARDPEIAKAANKAARQKLIKKLEQAAPGSAEHMLFDEFVQAKRIAEAASTFVRVGADDGGRFPLTGTGDVNTYGLFSELFSSLTWQAGWFGIIVPTEILSSDTLKGYFQSLVATGALRVALGFENEEFIFPGVANVVRFALLAIGPARQQGLTPCQFSFYLRNTAQIVDRRRHVPLTVKDFTLFNPNTLTCPSFRTRADAELTRDIYDRFPILINDSTATNPWGLRFLSMFHMAMDSSRFIDKQSLAASTNAQISPLYEGKFIWHFDHRFSSYHNLGKKKGRGGRGLPPVSLAEYTDPEFEIESRYWIPRTEVEKRLSAIDWPHDWLLGWRDVSSAKLERTFVTCAIPRGAAGHKLPLYFPAAPVGHIAGLLAVLSSITFDYVVRQKMAGTSFALHYLKQLPVPGPDKFSEADLGFVIPRVVELAYTSNSMRSFANDLKYTGSPFAWDEDRRALLRAELDAKVAQLYGLTRDQLRYILDPSEIYGPDYPSETFRVLKENEIKKFGEYRTAKLVLGAYDQLTEGTLSTSVARLDANRIEISQPQAESTLADDAWQRPREDARGETGAILVAILKALDGSQPARHVRLAAIMALEPRLLLPYLADNDATEWRRLVGEEAEPLPAGTVQFIPPKDQHWGAAVRQLRSSGLLVDDTSAGTWSPGEGLDTVPTNGWPDGRAQFVLSALSNMDATATEALPEELRRWIDAEAA